jgi:hypothetical protein
MSATRDRIDATRDWLRERQQISLEGPLVESAASSAARLGALARESAQTLPFDTEPGGFWRLLAALASPRKDG